MAASRSARVHCTPHQPSLQSLLRPAELAALLDTRNPPLLTLQVITEILGGWVVGGGGLVRVARCSSAGVPQAWSLHTQRGVGYALVRGAGWAHPEAWAAQKPRSRSFLTPLPAVPSLPVCIPTTCPLLSFRISTLNPALPVPAPPTDRMPISTKQRLRLDIFMTVRPVALRCIARRVPAARYFHDVVWWWAWTGWFAALWATCWRAGIISLLAAGNHAGTSGRCAELAGSSDEPSPASVALLPSHPLPGLCKTSPLFACRSFRTWWAHRNGSSPPPSRSPTHGGWRQRAAGSCAGRGAASRQLRACKPCTLGINLHVISTHLVCLLLLVPGTPPASSSPGLSSPPSPSSRAADGCAPGNTSGCSASPVPHLRRRTNNVDECQCRFVLIRDSGACGFVPPHSLGVSGGRGGCAWP